MERKAVVEHAELDVQTKTRLVLQTDYQRIMMVGDQALFAPDGFPHGAVRALARTFECKTAVQRALFCYKTKGRAGDQSLTVTCYTIPDTAVLRLLKTQGERTIR